MEEGRKEYQNKTLRERQHPRPADISEAKCSVEPQSWPSIAIWIAVGSMVLCITPPNLRLIPEILKLER